MTDDTAPDPANWTCQIGEHDRASLPPTSDGPMRAAVEKAYRELTGREPDYTFSGWGEPLSERHRAVVEDRLPDPKVSLAELEETRRMLIDEIGRQQPEDRDNLSALDRIDWIQRNVGRGAPESWHINDFVALVTVKLGMAVIELNPDDGEELTATAKASGRLELLAAAMICMDAADQLAT